MSGPGPSEFCNLPYGEALNRSQVLSRALIICTILLACPVLAVAQPRPQNPVPPEQSNADRLKSSDDKPGLGSPEEEMRIKQSIKLAEKEYKQNVERAREVAELSAELRDALKEGKTFGREETKKLERLEKLAKKIRDEAGGSSEDTLLNNPPGKLDSALSRLADVAQSLYKAIAKTPRQVISATVIENANVVVKLVRITRDFFR